MKIERVVVTGGRGFNDYVRIEADLHALVPLGLRRVAQGGNGVQRPRGLGVLLWVFSNSAAWVLTADAVKPGHSADAIAWHVACSYVSGQRDPGIKEVATYFADWDGHGRKRAGPIRNVEMLDAEKPDLVLAYPDLESRGTWHCVREALRRGIPVAAWLPRAWAPAARLPRLRAEIGDAWPILDSLTVPTLVVIAKPGVDVEILGALLRGAA